MRKENIYIDYLIKFSKWVYIYIFYINFRSIVLFSDGKIADR